MTLPPALLTFGAGISVLASAAAAPSVLATPDRIAAFCAAMARARARSSSICAASAGAAKSVRVVAWTGVSGAVWGWDARGDRAAGAARGALVSGSAAVGTSGLEAGEVATAYGAATALEKSARVAGRSREFP